MGWGGTKFSALTFERSESDEARAEVARRTVLNRAIEIFLMEFFMFGNRRADFEGLN